MPTMEDVMRGAREVMTVKRVFGEPVEKAGLTFIPVAAVRGGGGGGEGQGRDEGESGSGAGFGVTARPAGAYVIRGDSVEWRPALNVGRLALAGIGLLALLMITVAASASRRSDVEAPSPY